MNVVIASWSTGSTVSGSSLVVSGSHRACFGHLRSAMVISHCGRVSLCSLWSFLTLSLPMRNVLTGIVFLYNLLTSSE